MFFSKAVAFDEEELGNAALAAVSSSACSSAEAEFIERLKTGEAKAFDLLVTRYSGDIYALLYRITEDAEEAGDLTQETFLNALQSHQKLSRRGRFENVAVSDCDKRIAQPFSLVETPTTRYNDFVGRAHRRQAKRLWAKHFLPMNKRRKKIFCKKNAQKNCAKH